ncbi:MAG TPA: class I SAM-dependent methyltransferase [Gemmatimonadaceae bacterium]
MSRFSDHFSVAAPAYASFRPHYPAVLFRWLADQAIDRQRAWDCGTGNGQAAVALAAHFREVIATDPSVAQLAHAERSQGVHYAAMTAEQAALPDLSVDVVTVAQALHWFDLVAFYQEVARVLRPGGVFAAWSYGLITLGDDLDSPVGRFYHETVGAYWPSERSHVDTGYAGLELPFREESTHRFEMQAEWTLSQFAGYVATWSAVNRYRAARDEDPVPALVRELAPRWGAPGATRTVRWPLVIRTSRRPRTSVA